MKSGCYTVVLTGYTQEEWAGLSTFAATGPLPRPGDEYVTARTQSAFPEIQKARWSVESVQHFALVEDRLVLDTQVDATVTLKLVRP